MYCKKLGLYDEAIAEEQARKQKGIVRQRHYRRRARSEELPEKVRELVKLTCGVGEYECLRLHTNQAHTAWLYYKGDLVFQMTLGGNIQSYCPGAWEYILDPWLIAAHDEMSSELAEKRIELMRLKQATAAIDSRFCPVCS